MTIHYNRSKTLHLPNFYKQAAGVDASMPDRPLWIDTSGLEFLQLQVLVSEINDSPTGSFGLSGTNAAADTDPSAPSLSWLPVSIEQAGHGGATITLARSLALPGNMSHFAIVTYTRLPRWVKPSLTINNPADCASEMHVFGWMV